MRTSLLVCAFALLPACDKGSDFSGWDDPGTGDDSGDDSSASIDADKDGYASTEDCDDSNADVHPDATEVCDEIDNDCVDGVDEGLTTPFYADTDADGYGAGTAVDACTAPAGHVENADDCDDTSADAHPGGTEVCDGLDNNCLDGIDEDLLTTPFYADTDADGYGAGTAVDACTAPAGHVENADDCDDTSADAHPGGTEVCDGLDNNCLDGIDEDLLTTPYYADGDGDGFGAGTAVADCAASTGYVENADDCDDTTAAANPGATEVCDDVDNNCDGIVDGLCDDRYDRHAGWMRRICTEGVWSSWSYDECP